MGASGALSSELRGTLLALCTNWSQSRYALGDFVPPTESRQNQIPAVTTGPRWSGAHVTFLGSHDQDSAGLLCQGCAGAVVTGCSHSPACFSGMMENRNLPFKILFPQLRKDKLNSICSSSHDPCEQEPEAFAHHPSTVPAPLPTPAPCLQGCQCSCSATVPQC